MMTNIFHDSTIENFTDRPRVCLPHGIGLFDLCRWMEVCDKIGNEFQICSNGDVFIWRGDDQIDLFCQIQEKCLNIKLGDSFVRSSSDESIYFFDRHERFSFFYAERNLIDALFPFSREVMWENFALCQEEDSDFDLQKIFNFVHTKW